MRDDLQASLEFRKYNTSISNTSNLKDQKKNPLP